MASSRLIARHARETSGRLAPAAHFAKFESRRNGNFLRTAGVSPRCQLVRRPSAKQVRTLHPRTEHPLLPIHLPRRPHRPLLGPIGFGQGQSMSDGASVAFGVITMPEPSRLGGPARSTPPSQLKIDPPKP
jgi:hypothetical protein